MEVILSSKSIKSSETPVEQEFLSLDFYGVEFEGLTSKEVLIKINYKLTKELANFFNLLFL